MADVKWIKITTDVFDDEKILLIESLPDADAIIVIWFKLLCLAGKQNNSGVFVMGNSIPYTDTMLATIFRRKESTVQLALQTFEQFGMIEMIDGVITIPNWGKHQNLEQMETYNERMRKYMRDYRSKQKEKVNLIDVINDVNNEVSNVNPTDKIRKEEDKNIDKNNSDSGKPSKHKHGQFQHVLLTDDEFSDLADTYGAEYRDKAIKFLDEYIEEKGYKSKSHNLAIRRWVVDAVKEREDAANKSSGKNKKDFGFTEREYSQEELDWMRRWESGEFNGD